MAKIALVFLFAFCVFHLSAGARIVRDVDTAEAQKALDNSLQQVAQFFEKTFSKENLDKIGANLKQIGDQISERGKELVQQADAGIKKLQANEPAA